jgi:WW domain-containing oxidoreductase
MHLDLSSMRSCSSFCDSVQRQFKHIDFLILNAGIFAIPHTLTVDGLETIFQVCHLGHFFIATRLSHLLDHTSRVIVVSSESHRFANLPMQGLTRELLSVNSCKYWAMTAYNNAKLCNVLFACELSRRWQSRGISVFALHPGNLVSTRLQRHWWFYRVLFGVVRVFTKSLQQAAATSVYCATAQELLGLTGIYFNNCYICEPSKASQDENLAKELWNLSEKMISEVMESYGGG